MTAPCFRVSDSVTAAETEREPFQQVPKSCCKFCRSADPILPNTAPRVYSLQDSFNKHFLNTPCRGFALGYRRKENHHGGDRWPERKACWCVWEVIRRGLKNNSQLNSPSALRVSNTHLFLKETAQLAYILSVFLSAFVTHRKLYFQQLLSSPPWLLMTLSTLCNVYYTCNSNCIDAPKELLMLFYKHNHLSLLLRQ